MATLPHSWAVQPAVQSALGTVGAALAFVLFAAPACAPGNSAYGRAVL